jgi:hypothetical protein
MRLPALEGLACVAGDAGFVTHHKSPLVWELPALRDLELDLVGARYDGGEDDTAILTALASLPCAPRLRTLRLRNVSFAAIDALVMKRERFASLEELEYPFGNFEDDIFAHEVDAGRELLEHVFAGVRVSTAWPPEDRVRFVKPPPTWRGRVVQTSWSS